METKFAIDQNFPSQEMKIFLLANYGTRGFGIEKATFSRCFKTDFDGFLNFEFLSKLTAQIFL